MNEMIQFLLFPAGVGMLVLGAYLLVEGGSKVAAVLGVPPVVVGLTVVAFGTSAPEFFVSAIGALKGNTELVLGNVIGSNVANIGLILALAALVRPVTVEKQLPRREVPFLIAVTLVFFGLAQDNSLSRLDGGILTLLFVLFMGYTLRSGSRGEEVAGMGPVQPLPVDGRRARSLTTGSLQALAGMLGLAGGGHFIVTSATELAIKMGISEAVIGLTLVAVGTSLPELATTIMAAVKGQDDMALGNIIGSNLFNILGVAGPVAFASTLSSQVSIMPELLGMTLLTALVFFMIWPRHRSIKRWQGMILLAIYITCTVLWLV
jgi:cation:H+ antiporter